MTGSRDADPEVLFEAYHRWYYDSGLWMRTSFLGVPCLKAVTDLWSYQEILTALRPGLVVEFGVHRGGSTLYFATLLEKLRPDGAVLGVDPATEKVDPRVRACRNVELLGLSSTDPAVARRVRVLRQQISGPLFAVLDSDHRRDHVLAEMELLRPLLRAGDRLVVEDGNLNGHPVRPGWGEGPMEALLAYERRHPGDYTRDEERERRFGFTFAPRGYLVRR